MSIFDPPTFETAMDGIRSSDRAVRSLPLLSEQMRLMQDGPATWSTTHSWPTVREQLKLLGLVKALPATVDNGWVIPTTEITELGREVRAALSTPTSQP